MGEGEAEGELERVNPLGTGFFSGRKMIVIIGLSILNQNVPTKPS